MKRLNSVLLLIAIAALMVTLVQAATWRYPVPGVDNLAVGDLIAYNGDGLTNIAAVATGYVMSSAGVATMPVWTATPYVRMIRVDEIQITPVTLSPTGTATYTMPTTDYSSVYLNNASNNETILSEVGAASGQLLLITNISTGTAGFTDTAGVQEMTGNITLGQWDTLLYRYVVDRWVQVAYSNN
jgi:hypothetical protein